MHALKGAALWAAPALLGVAIVATGCGPTRDSATATSTTQSGPTSATPSVIDSILPIEEHLRRFRATRPKVDSLTNAAPSCDGLVRELLRLTAASDTSGLIRLLLTPSEYAWLYYPEHIYARPPYELDPDTFWRLVQGNSEKGLVRLLKQRGGNHLRLQSYACRKSPAVRAPVREWNECSLRLTLNGVTSTETLFGSIVEIGGRYKFVSLANQF